MSKIPAAKNSNWLLTVEKCLGVLHLELIVFPLSVDTVILEHVGLHTKDNQKIVKLGLIMV